MDQCPHTGSPEPGAVSLLIRDRTSEAGDCLERWTKAERLQTERVSPQTFIQPARLEDLIMHLTGAYLRAPCWGAYSTCLQRSCSSAQKGAETHPQRENKLSLISPVCDV